MSRAKQKPVTLLMNAETEAVLELVIEQRDAMEKALRAIDGGARPRAGVVGGKTRDYIVPRALIDAARAALKVNK